MAFDARGKVYIPGEEFWTFVQKFHPEFNGETRYGTPVWNPDSNDLEIEFATGETDPGSWAEPPEFLKKKP